MYKEDKTMDKYKFHILKENPKGKKESILQVEGICPSCGSRDVNYWQVKADSTEYSRFRYRCNRCYTEWIGNCFKSDYSFVDVWNERKELVKRIALIATVIFVFVLFVDGCNKVAQSFYERRSREKEVTQKQVSSSESKEEVTDNNADAKDNEVNSVKVTEKEKEVEEAEPKIEIIGVPLNQAKMINSDCFGFREEEVVRDFVGNEMPGSEIKNVARIAANRNYEGFAEFQVPANHKYFSGVVSASDECDLYSAGVLQISILENGEWHRVFATDSLSHKTTPFEVTIDTEDALKVRIELGDIEWTTSSKKFELFLSDFRFYENEDEIVTKVPRMDMPKELSFDNALCVSYRNYEANACGYADTIGNKYQNETFKLYAEVMNTGYADFYIGSSYDYVSFIAAPCSVTKDGSKGVVEVMCKNGSEWEKIYTSEVITKTTIPIPVTLDIRGKEWIRFLYRTSDTSGIFENTHILIADGLCYSGYERILEVNMPSVEEDVIGLEKLKRVANSGFDIASKKPIDAMGNEYAVRNTFVGYVDYVYTPYMSYFVDSEYTKLTGKASLMADSTDGMPVKVYIDAKKGNGEWINAYESPLLYKESMPEEFTVDISDKDFIRVRATQGTVGILAHSNLLLSELVISK